VHKISVILLAVKLHVNFKEMISKHYTFIKCFIKCRDAKPSKIILETGEVEARSLIAQERYPNFVRIALISSVFH